MAAIFETFSNAFPWMKMYDFRLGIHCSLFKFTISRHWCRQWLGAGHEIIILTHICVTRSQWVNNSCSISSTNWSPSVNAKALRPFIIRFPDVSSREIVCLNHCIVLKVDRPFSIFATETLIKFLNDLKYLKGFLISQDLPVTRMCHLEFDATNITIFTCVLNYSEETWKYICTFFNWSIQIRHCWLEWFAIKDKHLFIV